MPVDILDPGPNNDYPHWPRDAAGQPITTQEHARAAGSGTYVPTGTHLEPDADGQLRPVDLTPRKPDGTPIEPAVIPPATGA